MAINLSKIKFSSIDEVSVIISPKQTNSGNQNVTFYDLSGNRVTKIPSGKRDIAIRNKCYLGLKAYKNSERWEPIDPNEVDKHLNDADFKVAHSLSEDNKQPQKRTSEEKLEDEIQAKIEENRSFRKYGKRIFPALLILGIILISVDWTVTGWIILICDLIYLGTLWQSPTNYADVKNSILEEREERKQKQLEAKKQKEEFEANFVVKKEDKFNQTISYQTYSRNYNHGSITISSPKVDGNTLWWMSAAISLVIKDNIEALSFNIVIDRMEDWIFLRQGQFQILIDGNPTNLDAVDIETKVGTREIAGDIKSSLKERVMYMFKEQLLEKIYTCKDLELRFTSGTGSITIESEEVKSFKELCDKFYEKVFINKSV